MNSSAAASCPIPSWVPRGLRPVKVLGTGATGSVLHAVDTATNVHVAVKVLSPQFLEDQAGIKRFRREAVVLHTLTSPHVAQLYRYHESREGAAIIMELIDGRSLHELLRAQGVMTPQAALVLLKGSLLGLAAAHVQGLVHRDYKPGNVIVTTDGASKLVDFGIAVHQGAEAKSAGTPAYMAPEQWSAKAASPASDIYAATATFFECLTGQKPYSGITLPELALQHITAPIPEQLAPEETRQLIRRGMAKSPQDRPNSAEEFLRALERTAFRAYGENWEDEGRKWLAAALAVVLSLTAPSPEVGKGTDAATTILSPSPTTKNGGRRAQSRISRKALSVTAILSFVATLGIAGVLANRNAENSRETEVMRESEPTKDQNDSKVEPPTISNSNCPLANSMTSPTPKDTGVHSEGPGTAADASNEAQPSALCPSKDPNGTADASTSALPPTPTIEQPQSTHTPSPHPPFDTAPPPGATEGPTATEPSASSSAQGIPATPSPVEKPAEVLEVAITDFRPVGETTLVSITVRTNSLAPAGLTITWFKANIDSNAANPGAQDGSPESVILKGKTFYSLQFEHSFTRDTCTPRWGVVVSSSSHTTYQSIRSTPCR